MLEHMQDTDKNERNSRNLRGFFLRVVLPSVLSILLFIASFYIFIIPAFERAIMENKRQLIRELTITAWSILEKSEQEERELSLSREEAQSRALSRIRFMRYGVEGKDYFWVTDMHPRMIMHPYKPELDGEDLSDYSDPTGKKLFKDFVTIVEKQGEGYLEYLWQWMDDPGRIVPKISFVKGFEPWGWIIGTGIYVQDVREETRRLERNLIWISVIISILIIVFLFIVIQQSLKIEIAKEKAQRELFEIELGASRDKYNNLTERINIGIFRITGDGKNGFVEANTAAVKIFGAESKEALIASHFQDYLADDAQKSVLLKELTEKGYVTDRIVSLSCKGGIRTASLSLAKAHEPVDFYDGIIEDITEEKIEEREKERLIADMQVSLLYLNQPVRSHIKPAAWCDMRASIAEASRILREKQCGCLILRTEHDGDCIGMATDADFRNRALAENLSPAEPVYRIMTSPIVSVSEEAPLYEANRILSSGTSAYIAVKNSQGTIIGVVSATELLAAQEKSPMFLIKEIENAPHAEAVAVCGRRLRAVVKAMLSSGTNAEHSSRLIASVSLATQARLISLALEELGPPPVPFAYIALGSSGRNEQTLKSDQDNAIIFSDVEEQDLPNVSAYFLALGTKISTDLDRAGYTFCEGGNMAGNPKWCRTIGTWKEYFASWVSAKSPEDLLEFSIFFDFSFVFGDETFVKELKDHIGNLLCSQPDFFLHLAAMCLRSKPLLNAFGNIASDSFNIKDAMLPIVNFARLYALKHAIPETNTLKRLERLFEKGILSDTTYRDTADNYKELLGIRLRYQAETSAEEPAPANIINIKKSNTG